jgi:RNA recognition motif-containing protein
MMNIYVGNLSWGLSEDDLREAFESYGEVDSVKIIQDKMTGRSRGFGFVEMPDDSEAKSAIAELNGKELDGRAIKVNEARPKRDDRGGGRGFGRR